ncbi:MAG: hypothetical protein J2P28_26520 [Actinobacteria bacterium]|nr:hypothetical protein [Actinomycetota bacterium]
MDNETPVDRWPRLPPADVLPAIVPAGHFLIRTERVILALSHLSVYPDGCALELLGRARGPEATIDDFWRLVFTVEFGAERATLYDKTAPHWRPDGGPALQLTPGGTEGTQTNHRIEVSLPLWLSPLPPAVAGSLSLERRETGAGPVSCPLDGEAIVAAAGLAQPFWQ